jgi:hypothetical protein
VPFRTTLAFLLYLALHPSPSPALDWPQWRGRNRDGISKDKGLLKEWQDRLYAFGIRER